MSNCAQTLLPAPVVPGFEGRVVADGPLATTLSGTNARGERVRVEVLHAGAAPDEALEAVLAALKEWKAHPQLLAPLDAGRTADGRLFFALAAGDPELQGWLATRGPLDETSVASVGVALCQAATELLARGLAPRVLRPEGILLRFEATGISARVADVWLQLLARHVPGCLERLPRPAPPEPPSTSADARAAVFALGIVLKEALTGDASPLVELNPSLRLAPVLNRCLSADAAARYDDPAALAEALAPFTSPVQLVDDSAFERTHVNQRGGPRETPPPATIDRLGPYEIVRTLGEGSMGRVYLARHTRLGRHVALKMLREEHVRSRELVERFFQEAKAVNQINHEHIVEIFDFVDDPARGQAFCVMELLCGRSLSQVLTQERLSVARTLGIGVQLAGALQAAHRVGVVHRDVKPDNIFVTDRAGNRDYVKVLDFGVAKLLTPVGANSAVAATLDGMIIGTPRYMAPEQAAGFGVDHRADLYSVGTVLYEMLAGKLPFDAPTFGQLSALVITKPPPPLPAKTPSGERIPLRLRTLVLQCLEKDPSKRPQTMAELAQALERIRLGLPSAGRVRFGPYAAVAAGALAIGAAVLLGGVHESRAAKPEAAVLSPEVHARTATLVTLAPPAPVELPPAPVERAPASMPVAAPVEKVVAPAAVKGESAKSPALKRRSRRDAILDPFAR